MRHHDLLGPHTAETQSGLEPWTRAELPVPPRPAGLGWLQAVGPGVIVLGVSIGGGEFLLGPAAFVRHGLSLLWVVGIAVFLQTVFNTELMRYTLATGEPVFTGFMRTRPSSTLWAWVYAILYFLQVGWPASAGAAAGAIFFLGTRRLPGPADGGTIYAIGVGRVSAVRRHPHGRAAHRADARGAELDPGHRDPRQLPAAGALVRPGGDVGGRRPGLRRLRSAPAARSTFVPPGTDLFLLAALVAYSGARRREQHRAVQLGARPRLRHGGAGGLHPRRRRRHQGRPGAHGLHVRRLRQRQRAVARLVAHHQRRPVGRVRRWAPSSGCCCRRCST